MTTALSPEERLILNAARVDLDEQARDGIRRALTDGIDWDVALALARREGVGSLLRCSLAATGAEADVPPAAWAWLGRSTAVTWARNAVLAAAWTEAMRTLATAGVPAITLKGMALAHTVYRDPALRPMVDVDVLVRPADVAVVRRLLVGLGYRTPDEAETAEEASRGYLHFVRARTVIDLHWELARYSRFSAHVEIDHESLWHRAVPFEIGGAGGLALRPEDNILHLAIHLSLGSEFGRVIWFSDIDAAIRRVPLDWDRLIADAERWRVRSLLAFILGVVRRSFATPVPEAVLARIMPSRARMAAVAACLGITYPPSLRRGWSAHRAYIAEALLMDRGRDVAAVMVRSLFPTRTWLRFHYRTESRLGLAGFRLVHPARVCWLALRHLL